MKKMLSLLFVFASVGVSAHAAQETIKVEIFRTFKSFGRSDNVPMYVHLKTVEVTFSDDMTIGDLKKLVAAKAGVSAKKLKGSFLRLNDTTLDCEDNQTCKEYNLKEISSIGLVLQSSAVGDFFRSVASVPGVVAHSIAHRFAR